MKLFRHALLIIPGAFMILAMAILSCSDQSPIEPPILSSGPWIKQDSPNTNSLNAVWGTSSNNIIAVGDRGAVVKYDGHTWETVPTGLIHNLYDVWGISENNIYIAGQNGLLLRFDGTEFTQISIPTQASLRDIWGSSEDEIYIAGDSGRIMIFDGTDWSSFTPEEASINQAKSYRSVYGISFSPVHPGIRPQKMLFATPQIGPLELYDKLPLGNTFYTLELRVTAIHGSNWDNIFAVGYAGLFFKFDGVEWESLRPRANHLFLRDVFVIDSKNTLVAVNNGTIMHFNGTDISYYTTSPSANLYGIWGEPGGKMVAVGYNGNIFMSH